MSMKSESLRRITIALGLTAATSACVHSNTATAASKTPPWLDGYVYRVQNNDTVPVANASVHTIPESDKVATDSNGYWKITAGLVPGRYSVVAEIPGGADGKVSKVIASLGKTPSVKVLIGADLPDPSIFNPDVGSKGSKGDGKIRQGCCE